MKMQQFNPKMISISQLRRDVDILEEVLASEEEALVMRNQSLLFVALTPEKYQRLQNIQGDKSSIKKAVLTIKRIRNQFGQAKKSLVSDYISRMREKRVKRWKK